MKYKFKDAEINKLLKNIVIVCDTNEQENSHILEWFKKKKKKYILQKVNYGDYTACIESNEETKPLGLNRDWYFSNDIAIERKASIDELIGNFCEGERLNDEFFRSNKYGAKMFLFVEDNEGRRKLSLGDYRSRMTQPSALSRFKTLEARFDAHIQFMDKDMMGYEIYQTLKYHVRELLKNSGYIEYHGEELEDAKVN